MFPHLLQNPVDVRKEVAWADLAFFNAPVIAVDLPDLNVMGFKQVQNFGRTPVDEFCAQFDGNVQLRIRQGTYTTADAVPRFQ